MVVRCFPQNERQPFQKLPNGTAFFHPHASSAKARDGLWFKIRATRAQLIDDRGINIDILGSEVVQPVSLVFDNDA